MAAAAAQEPGAKRSYFLARVSLQIGQDFFCCIQLIKGLLNEYSIVQHKTIRLHSPTLYFWATLRHCLPKSTIISAPKKVPSVGFELPSKERQQVSNNRKPFIHKEESREKW